MKTKSTLVGMLMLIVFSLTSYAGVAPTVPTPKIFVGLDTVLVQYDSIWSDKTPCAVSWNLLQGFDLIEYDNNVTFQLDSNHCSFKLHPVTPLQPGTHYTFNATFSNPFGSTMDTGSFTTLSPLAIAEPAQKTCSVIPIGKQLQVKSPAEYMGAAIQVYNILGEKVFHTTIENEKQTIDLSGRASGAYYLVSLEPTTSSAKKVVMRIYISP